MNKELIDIIQTIDDLINQIQFDIESIKEYTTTKNIYTPTQIELAFHMLYFRILKFEVYARALRDKLENG